MSTEIAIRTEGGLLTLSPEKLLDYYLPEAQSVPGRVGTFEAPHPTKANEKIYVQEAVLVGMLHEAKQRHLNPVSEMYLIPSNAVNKKASWKLKYTAQLDQLRKLPGFLALHSGVIVERKGEWLDLPGTLLRPGDKLVGAWAEADFASHRRPIRHEVAMERVKGLSPLWQSKPEFMLLKVVTDELIRLKIAPQFGLIDPKDPDFQEVGEEIVLEADEGTDDEAKTRPLAAPHDYPPGDTHRVTLVALTEKTSQQGRTYLLLDFQTEYGDALSCFAWSRPDVVKEIDEVQGDRQQLIGEHFDIVFKSTKSSDGTPMNTIVSMVYVLPVDDTFNQRGGQS